MGNQSNVRDIRKQVRNVAQQHYQNALTAFGLTVRLKSRSRF